MTREINGVGYFSVSETAKLVGCSRVSIWRWAKAGAIPKGRLFRDSERLFTKEEVEEINNYYNRIESTPQLNLFNNMKNIIGSDD